MKSSKNDTKFQFLNRQRFTRSVLIFFHSPKINFINDTECFDYIWFPQDIFHWFIYLNTCSVLFKIKLWFARQLLLWQQLDNYVLERFLLIIKRLIGNERNDLLNQFTNSSVSLYFKHNNNINLYINNRFFQWHIYEYFQQ